MHKFLLFIPLMLLLACTAMRVPGTQAESTDRLALVTGDYRIRASAPVNVYLRSVDGQVLAFWQQAAEVAAGNHSLLVDCSVAKWQKISRHELNVTLHAGVHYYLRAEANPQQGCTRIILDEVR